MAGNLSKKEKQQIKVFVRVRPINNQEKEARSHAIVEATGKDVIVSQAYEKKYSFDRAFGPKAKQMDVYKSVVHPLISEVLAGYNCTVFAYGQTGTGKTFTMAGGTPPESYTWTDNNSVGIIPRALAHLYEELQLQNQEYSVRVSYLELYNEELFDLLSPIDDRNIRIYEQKGQIVLQGLEEIIVQDKAQVYKILDKGTEKRRTASTLMNASSSRSHTVFTITVHTREVSACGEELVKTGKLNLVDLAGSENIGKSGAVEMRAREAGNINQSLLTLGRVITALVERAGHVPYRESKLTRILQDSLGGRTKTSIIATVSPAMCNIEETLSTLDYAHRARNIMNRPEINQRMSKQHVLSQFNDEIARLRKDLEATRLGTGICLAKENYDQIIYQLEMQKTELSDKITQIRTLKQEMDEKEEEWDNLVKSLKTAEEQYQAVKEKCDGLTVKIDTLEKDIKETERKQKEAEYLAAVYESSGKNLCHEIMELKSTVHRTVADKAKLHDKVDKFYDVTSRNKQLTTTTFKNIDRSVDKINDQLKSYTKFQKTQQSDLKSRTQEHDNNHTQMCLQMDSLMKQCLANENNYSENFTHSIEALKTKINSSKNSAANLTIEELQNLKKVHQESMLMMQNNVANLHTNFKNISALTATFLENQKSDIAKFAQSSDEINSRIMQNLADFRNEVQTNVCKISQQLEKTEDILAKHKSNRNERRKKYEENVEAVMNALQKLKNDVADQKTCNDDEHSELENEVETLRSPTINIYNKVSCFDADVLAQIEEDVATQKTELENVQLSIGTFAEKQTEAEDKVQKEHERYLKHDTITVESVPVKFDQAQKNITDSLDEIGCTVSVLKKIQENSQNHHAVVIESITTEIQNVENIKFHTTNNRIYVDENVVNSDEKLQSFRSQVQHAIDELKDITNVEISEVSKTGETPVRNNMKCSLTPKLLEPRHMVLQKYRDQINEVEDLLKSPLSTKPVVHRSHSDVPLGPKNKEVNGINANNVDKSDKTRLISVDATQSKIPIIRGPIMDDNNKENQSV